MTLGTVLKWRGDQVESHDVEFEDSEPLGSDFPLVEISDEKRAFNGWTHKSPATRIFGSGEGWTQEDTNPSLRASQATLKRFSDLLKDARRKRQIDQERMEPGTVNDYAQARDRLIGFVHEAIWPGEVD